MVGGQCLFHNFVGNFEIIFGDFNKSIIPLAFVKYKTVIAIALSWLYRLSKDVITSSALME